MLKEIYRPEADYIDLPGSDIRIQHLSFRSETAGEGDSIMQKYYPAESRDDLNIKENRSFRYPVFSHRYNTQQEEVIILLHGLNERNWNKYLSWASELCKQTGKAVLLFPFSFHVNRTPSDWLSREKIRCDLQYRQKTFKGLQHSSPVNVSLSQRLSESPERFFYSGYQTMFDLKQLAGEIRQSKHPLFHAETQLHYFGYSVSGLLLQTMMIGEPEFFDDKSRFVFFAAGSYFNDMNGQSKYIMDNAAFRRLHEFYNARLSELMRGKHPASVPFRTRAGEAFRSMLDQSLLPKLREKRLRLFFERTRVLALAKDRVIPAKGIRSVFSFEKKQHPHLYTCLDFDYPYIHENPFPANLKEKAREINDAFSRVFDLSAQFFAL